MVKANSLKVFVLVGVTLVTGIVTSLFDASAMFFSKQDMLRLSPVSISIQSDSSLPIEVRRQEADSLSTIYDRSTTSMFTAYGLTKLVFKLDSEQEVTHLKFFGPAAYSVTVRARDEDSWRDVMVNGKNSVDLSKQAVQWNRFDLDQAIKTDQLLLELTPVKVKGQNALALKAVSKAPAGGGNGGSGGNVGTQTVPVSGIYEFEIWGKQTLQNTSTGRDLWEAMLSETIPAHGNLYSSKLESGIIGALPVLAEDKGDNTFSVTINRHHRDFKRAWLTYNTYGAGHWVSTVRSINGNVVQGGIYRFESSAWSSEIELINPEWLVVGENTIEFSVPGKEHSYNISDVSLLLELDTGANIVSYVEASPVGDTNPEQAFSDGDLTTAWYPYIGSTGKNGGGAGKDSPHIDLYFDRPAHLDNLILSMAGELDGKIEIEFFENDVWQAAIGVGAITSAKVKAGWNTINIDSKGAVEGVRLLFVNGRNANVAIQEVIPVGSSVGPRYPHHIEVTYPEAGEYYGDHAYLRGFIQPLDNGSGAATLSIAGKTISTQRGAYEALVALSDAKKNDDGTYSVNLEATYPDGEKISHLVDLWYPGDADLVDGTMVAYYANRVIPVAVGQGDDEKNRLVHDEGALDIPSGAKENGKKLTISSLKKRDLAPLDAGMVNVTKGPRYGYRFGPHGSKFKKNIKVEIPYDRNKLLDGLTEDDIKTYFYNETLGKWVALDRIALDKDKQVVISYTDHFTDMINATITVPESPQISDFTPTTIKDIKAADPGANINLIEPPKATNMGDANLNYPIEVPPGRNGLQPQLAISYSSGGGNGWLGLGWDLSVPSISVDTRWGVPRYSTSKETETYMLEGQMLTPVAHIGELHDRYPSDKEFYPRKESEFKKIVRKGNSPNNYWWEVTDKSGTVFTYGAASSGSTDAARSSMLRAGNDGNISKWHLRKVKDVNGNTMTYNYENYTHPAGGAEGDGKQVYLNSVNYTGHGDTNGEYAVEFTREQSHLRPDVSIDMRNGFKVITPYRLSGVKVKRKNGNQIRRYELIYREGSFKKTLLEKVKQYDGNDSFFNEHAFSYYNDVPASGSELNIFAERQAVPTGREDISIPFSRINRSFDASVIGGTSGENVGWSASVGIGFPPFAGKAISGTLDRASNTSKSEGYSQLMDVDGDGLPDKVFKDGNNIYYRKNITPAGSSRVVFETQAAAVNIGGISRLSKTKSESVTYTPQSNAIGSAGVSKTDTSTTEEVFISDVNGDGLPDVIENGKVKFNTAKADKTPAFSMNSFDTTVPLGGIGEVDTGSLLPSFDDALAQMKEKNPLMDAVRVWTAPYSGQIRVTGTVSLVDTSEERKHEEYKTADGVSLSIEHGGLYKWGGVGSNKKEIKLSVGKEIKEVDGIKIPVTTYPHNSEELSHDVVISVAKGDKVFFRVGAIVDGSYDSVNWAPSIKYQKVGNNNVSSVVDENNYDVTLYDAKNDFVTTGRDMIMQMPYKGDIIFKGVLNKTEKTTDDVTLVISSVYGEEVDDADMESGKRLVQRNRVIHKEIIPWDLTGKIDVGGKDGLSFKVVERENISVYFKVDSPINVGALRWGSGFDKDGDNKEDGLPELYYTHATQMVPASSDNITAPSSGDGGSLSMDDLLSNVHGNSVGQKMKEVELDAKDKDGNYIYNISVNYDADIYSKQLPDGIYSPWVAPRKGVVFVTPLIEFKDNFSCEYKYVFGRKIATSCRSNYKVPDAPIFLTAKKRSELVYKKEMKALDFVGDSRVAGYENLFMLSVDAGEEIFFDLTMKNTAIYDQVKSVQLRFNYADDTAWSVPIKDEVSIKAILRNSYREPVAEPDAFGVVPPAKDEKYIAYLIRKGNEIVDRQIFKLPIYPVSADPHSDDAVTYPSDDGYLLDVTLPKDIDRKDDLYFDIVSVDNQYTSVDVKKVSTSYRSDGEFVAGKNGRVIYMPILSFTEGTDKDGRVLLQVYKDGVIDPVYKYLLDVIDGKVDGVIKKDNRGNEYKDQLKGELLYVIRGERYTFHYSTDDYVLASELLDKGRVEVGYIDEFVALPNINEGRSQSESINNVSLSLSANVKMKNEASRDLGGHFELRMYSNNEIVTSKEHSVENGELINGDNAITEIINGGSSYQLAVKALTKDLFNSFEAISVVGEMVSQDMVVTVNPVVNLEPSVSRTVVIDGVSRTETANRSQYNGSYVVTWYDGGDEIGKQTVTIESGQIQASTSSFTNRFVMNHTYLTRVSSDSWVLSAALNSMQLNGVTQGALGDGSVNVSLSKLAENYTVSLTPVRISLNKSLNIDLPIFDVLSAKTVITMPDKYDLQLAAVPHQFNMPVYDNLLGKLYRGWGYLGYNANHNRDTQAIVESLLVLSENPNQNTQDEKNVYVAVGDFTKQHWTSFDGDWGITATTMSPTRLGANYTDALNPADFAMTASLPSGYAPAMRVPRRSSGDQLSISAGFIINVNHNSGGASGSLDVIDMNGDRFPDIVSNSSIQYTNMDGSLGVTASTDAVRAGLGKVRDSDDESTSYSMGPSSAESVASARGVSTGAPPKPPEPSAVKSPSLSPSFGSSKTKSDLMDINGDGLPDRVYSFMGYVKVKLNNGYGFESEVTWGSGKLSTSENRSLTLGGGFSDGTGAYSGSLNLSRSNNFGNAALMDFNGDGLVDYVHTVGTNIKVKLNNGTGFEDSELTFKGALPSYAINPVTQEENIDYDKVHLSDGASTSLTGSVKTTPGVPFWVIFGFAPVPIFDTVIGGGGMLGWTVGRPTITYTDINGDGYIDAVRSRKGSEITVALNQTNRTNLLQKVTRPMGATVDIDYQRSEASFDQQSPKWVMSKVIIKDGVNDTIGQSGRDTQVIEYDYQDGFHDRFDRDFLGFAKVVESYKDGSTIARKIEKHYANLYYAEKGLLLSETIKDGSDNIYRVTQNNYDLYRVTDADEKRKKGILFSVKGDVEYSQRRPSKKLVYIGPEEVIFPQQVESHVYTYEPGSSGNQHSYTTQTYDEYGNVRFFSDEGDTNVSDDDVIAEITYHQDKAKWIMAKPNHIKVTDNAGKVLRERRAGYDDKGNLTSVQQYLADGKVAETNLTYDGFGNIKSVTGPVDANGQRRLFEFDYDNVVNTHVVAIRDKNFGYSSKAEYEYNFGKVLSTTDLNNNAMSYTYDSVGRVRTITGPYEQGTSDATISFDYFPFGQGSNTIPFARTYHIDPENTGNKIETVLFTDGLKRVLQTKKDAAIYKAGSVPVESRTVSGRVAFDGLGRTIQQYYPTMDTGAVTVFVTSPSGVAPTETTYDALDRTTLVKLPDGSQTRTIYGFDNDRAGLLQASTTVIDAEGNKKVTYKDARQLITTVKEWAKDTLAGSPAEQVLQTSYAYDPMKQITQVKDAKGNITSVSYDNLGRRLTINNPDMGLVSMEYDLAGNMIHKITANLAQKSQKINYSYEFGRLKSIAYPNNPADVQGCTVAVANSAEECVGASNNVTYEYGAPGASDNRAGRITKVIYQAGNEERFYGKLGEMVKEIDTINFDPSQHFTAEIFVTRYHYDSWGRMKQLTYPDGDKTIYHYDVGGQVNRVTGEKGGVQHTFIETIQYDEFEQRKFIRFGNGVETTYEYDPQRRYLEHLQSAGKYGTFQNLSYSFDKVGNILSRANDVNPINGVGGKSTQNYHYDSLLQLGL